LRELENLIQSLNQLISLIHQNPLLSPQERRQRMKKLLLKGILGLGLVALPAQAANGLVCTSENQSTLEVKLFKNVRTDMGAILNQEGQITHFGGIVDHSVPNPTGPLFKSTQYRIFGWPKLSGTLKIVSATKLGPVGRGGCGRAGCGEGFKITTAKLVLQGVETSFFCHAEEF
jgi:hypothetical protein